MPESAAKARRYISGQIFGDWTVKEFDALFKKRHPKWICICTCGKVKSVYECHLISGKSKTCSTGGTHGIGKCTPGYKSWAAMIDRCTLKGHIHYDRYGGRGIKVCERWRAGFVNFYGDMGPRPDGMSLDRIDGNGNYEPSNCRWATVYEQQSNMKSNVFVEIDGIRMTLAQHARRLGVKYPTLYSRLKRSGDI